MCCPSALPGLPPGRERSRGYMVGKEKRVTQEAKQTVTLLFNFCPDLLQLWESSFDGCGMKAGYGPRAGGPASHTQAPGVRQLTGAPGASPYPPQPLEMKPRLPRPPWQRAVGVRAHRPGIPTEPLASAHQEILTPNIQHKDRRGNLNQQK